MTRRWKITLVALGVIVFLFLVASLALVRYANVIAKAGVEKVLGKDFSVGAIELKWGTVRARNIAMKNPAGADVIRIEEIVVRADPMNFFRKKHIISSLQIEKPYMYVEVGHKGDLVNPYFSEEERRILRKVMQQEVPVRFEKIIVRGGSVDYLDRKTPRIPVLTKVRDIRLGMEHLTVPFTNDPVRYSLEAHVPAGGSTASIKSDGNIKFVSKDIESASHIRGLDITHFKPYYDKQAKSVHVKRGIMDLDVRAKVVSRKIHAPGHAVLKGLEVETGSGLGDRFMGVSASLVLNFMKKNGDQIPVDFVVSGDLDNPKFNITENFIARFSYGMAEKLGVSIKDIGGSIISVGAQGTKKVGEGIKEGFKKIFK